MLLSKGHLTGRALDSNPKARMCRPEIRFHQVPGQCFPSAAVPSVRKVGGVSRAQSWRVFAALQITALWWCLRTDQGTAETL